VVFRGLDGFTKNEKVNARPAITAQIKKMRLGIVATEAL
jgi:hypothetical protein